MMVDDSWWDKRNARRREKYHADKEYRMKMVKASRVAANRDGYDPKSLADATKTLREYARPREVRFYAEDGTLIRKKTLKAVTIEEMAKVLKTSPQVLNRWRSSGKLPQTPLRIPVIMEYAGSGKEREIEIDVYLADQVMIAIKVLHQHYKETPYYHAKHTDVRNQLTAGFLSVLHQVGFKI